MTDQTPTHAGDYMTWTSETLTSLAGRADADVPCGSCTACCRSSQFILIEPGEPARSHIDPGLLAAAAGLPAGFDVMGYDEHGHCPMLVDERCSIYEYRPRTCRTYDCRVFPAAGIWPEQGTKVEITNRARSWRFEFDDSGMRASWATRKAGAYLRERQIELFGDDPPEATQLAAMAVAAHELFVGGDTPAIDDVRGKLRNGRDSGGPDAS